MSMKEGRLSLLGITQLGDIALKNLGKEKKTDLNQDMKARVVLERLKKDLRKSESHGDQRSVIGKRKDQYEALIDEYKEAMEVANGRFILYSVKMDGALRTDR